MLHLLLAKKPEGEVNVCHHQQQQQQHEQHHQQQRRSMDGVAEQLFCPKLLLCYNFADIRIRESIHCISF